MGGQKTQNAVFGPELAALRRAAGIAGKVAWNLIRVSGPGSRFEILLWSALGLALSTLVAIYGFHLAGPLLRVPPHPALATLDGQAYLPDEDAVEKVFGDLAAAESAAEIVAREQFPDHRWSQQDKRAEIMCKRTRKIAGRHRMSVALVYLIHQKGISEHWPGKDGEPLEVQVIPRTSRHW
jgi:hypothetical protein